MNQRHQKQPRAISRLELTKIRGGIFGITVEKFGEPVVGIPGIRVKFFGKTIYEKPPIYT